MFFLIAIMARFPYPETDWPCEVLMLAPCYSFLYMMAELIISMTVLLFHSPRNQVWGHWLHPRHALPPALHPTRKDQSGKRPVQSSYHSCVLAKMWGLAWERAHGGWEWFWHLTMKSKVLEWMPTSRINFSFRGLTSHCYAGFAIELPLLLHRPQFSKRYHVWIGHIQGSSLLNTCNYYGPHNLVIGLIVK